MNLQRLLFVCLGAVVLTSCFKDEAPNAEADITKAWLHTDVPTEMFFQTSDTLINVLYSANEIKFSVRRKADVSALAPQFTITEGATISPASGSTHDFSQGPITYTVTSEDKQWTRDYAVSFTPVVQTVKDTIDYDFEHFALVSSGKYYTWFELQEDGTEDNRWATGNGGFVMTAGSAAPDAYPTAPLTEGYDGNGVRLVTRSTGSFGKLTKMPLAAGNLFIGEFDVSIAVKTPLMATRFGLPFDKKPKTFTGYYRYKAGDSFTNRDGSVVDGKKDQASVYAILYRNHDADGNAVVLHGDDVQTNPLIVGKAIVAELPETAEWREFKVDFSYAEEIDIDLMAERGYSLAIVFSSSADGAYFQGAIGSTLDIDKVRIVCETQE